MSAHELVAVVTGAASGIGAASAVQLAADGYAVALLDREESGLATTRERCGGDRVFTRGCDVRDEAAIHDAIAAIVAWGGRIDILVNAAGVIVRSDTLETTADEWNTVLDINLGGTFRMVQAAWPHLIDEATAGHKRVVNIASAAAVQGYRYPAYSASKGGVVALTRQLAAELAPHRVTVNAINPGVIMTALNADNWSAEEFEEWAATMPLGRLGQPEDIAGLVGYLSSPAASFITGEAILIDGGKLNVTTFVQGAR